MAATVTTLDTPRGRNEQESTKAGGPTIRVSIDAFLDTPTIKGNPNTLRAYTNVLDRVADQLAPDRALAGVADAEIADPL
jgi:hypothetical protein